jgi:hypothetical protein
VLTARHRSRQPRWTHITLPRHWHGPMRWSGARSWPPTPSPSWQKRHSAPSLKPDSEDDVATPLLSDFEMSSRCASLSSSCPTSSHALTYGAEGLEADAFLSISSDSSLWYAPSLSLLIFFFTFTLNQCVTLLSWRVAVAFCSFSAAPRSRTRRRTFPTTLPRMRSHGRAPHGRAPHGRARLSVCGVVSCCVCECRVSCVVCHECGTKCSNLRWRAG